MADLRNGNEAARLRGALVSAPVVSLAAFVKRRENEERVQAMYRKLAEAAEAWWPARVRQREEHARRFGTRLRQIRCNVAMTQAEVAAAAEMSTGRLASLEAGRTKGPLLHEVEALARALGVRFEALAFGEERFGGVRACVRTP